jgi:DNA-binding NarL/FixJ family response regulator
MHRLPTNAFLVDGNPSHSGFHMLRILIADDHEVVRSGLRRVLETQTNWEVVAEAGDGKDAISKAAETNPDVAVLDYFMPLINGIEATREIRARLPKTEVLIFTIDDDEKLIAELLRAGARGYVSKAAAKQDLLDAIETVGVHRSYFGCNVTEILLKAYLAHIRNEMPLSDQETRVVKLVGEGHTNNQIAKIFNITVRTVETHRAAAMRKLNVSSSAGLVRHAVRIGLVEA